MLNAYVRDEWLLSPINKQVTTRTSFSSFLSDLVYFPCINHETYPFGSTDPSLNMLCLGDRSHSSRTGKPQRYITYRRCSFCSSTPSMSCDRNSYRTWWMRKESVCWTNNVIRLEKEFYRREQSESDEDEDSDEISSRNRWWFEVERLLCLSFSFPCRYPSKGSRTRW